MRSMRRLARECASCRWRIRPGTSNDVRGSRRLSGKRADRFGQLTGSLPYLAPLFLRLHERAQPSATFAYTPRMADDARGYLTRQLETAWKLAAFHLDE